MNAPVPPAPGAAVASGPPSASRAFSPELLRLVGRAPSPLPRALLWTLTALVACALAGAWIGRLDMIAVANGRLVPEGYLKVVQPAEAGIVRELLVQEGDVVEAGEILARMDPRLSDADAATLSWQVRLQRLQLRRIDAELSGRPFESKTDDPPALVSQVGAQHGARIRAHSDTLAIETAAVERSRNDLRAAVETQTKLARSLPIHREQAEGWETLAKEGFAGKLLALERRRQWLEAEQDLKAQEAQVESLRANLVQGERRVAQLRSAYRRELLDERTQVQTEIERLARESKRLAVGREQLELRAPTSGVVKELATHTAGTVVQPGTVLMTVVPRAETVLAEVWVEQVDAGFVREQMPVQVKIATFPFQKYGMASGRIRHFSPDASDAPAGNQGGEPRAAASGPSAYRALVTLESSHLYADGRRLDLVPGMQVSAEIHLGTRSVMEYLLSPLRKTIHESGREQ
jgi:HlyD family secretion protein